MATPQTPRGGPAEKQEGGIDQSTDLVDIKERLALAEFDIQPAAPAPMLQRSNEMKALLALPENKGRPNCNFSVGEPAIDQRILSQMHALLFTPDSGAIYPPLQETPLPPMMTEIQEWLDGMTQKMVKYAPKPGDPALRNRFLQQEGQGIFTSDLKKPQHIITTGGFDVVMDNVEAMIRESAIDKEQKVKKVDLRGGFDAAIDQIDQAQKEGSYILVISPDSGLRLTDAQNNQMRERMKNGRMMVLDLLEDTINPRSSLGADGDRGVSDFVISITHSEISRLTGVFGWFSTNDVAIKYVLERNTNLKGTPSAEMYLLEKITEFADQDKFDELMALTNEVINAVHTPNHHLLQDTIRLLQYAAVYLYYQGEDADTIRYGGYEAHQRLITDRLSTLEQQTKDILVTRGLMTENMGIAWDNGGARNSDDMGIQYLVEKMNSRTIGILAPCWSFLDLQRDHRKLHMIQAFDKTGFQKDGVIAWIKSHSDQNASLIMIGGPENPTAFFISPQEAVAIAEAALQHKVHVIFDNTYALYLRQQLHDEGRLTARLEEFFDTSDVVAMSNFSASKNLISPMLRISAIMSANRDVIDYIHNSPSRKSGDVNALAILLLHTLTSDPDRFNSLIGDVSSLAGQRVGSFQRKAQERGYEYSKDHAGGYYTWIIVKALQNRTAGQRKEILDELQQKHLISVLSFVDDLNADPKIWDGAIRCALVANPEDDAPAFDAKLDYFFKILDELNQFKLRG